MVTIKARQQRRRRPNPETMWLREWARTLLSSDGTFSFSPQGLRDAEVTLVEIRYAMRFSTVVFTEKEEASDAYWIAEGPDGDGSMLVLYLRVDVNVQRVRLLKAARITEEEGGNDAA